MRHHEYDEYDYEDEGEGGMDMSSMMSVLTPMVTFMAGMAVGAGLMYMMDPEVGSRRRLQAREAAGRYMHRTQDTMRQQAQRLSGRGRQEDMTRGAETMTSQQDTMDDIDLREKIRSRLQERIDNADRIEIEVSGGMVTLSGSAKTHEVDRIIDAASTLPNVRSVINRISVQGQPTGSSGMPGI